MKIEKAIEELKSYVELWESEQVDYDMNVIIYKNTIESFNLAIQALRNRIPKKVELIFSPSGHEIYFCPSCQENVNEDDWYCSQCGQKLDWEVEE